MLAASLDSAFDYLIVGAGFAGAVLAERLTRVMGKHVLVVDRRDHVGGNAHDFYDHAGILVHRYGPHIFHTNDRRVFDYLSDFTEWRWYEHRVLASVDGQLLPIPINLDTINRLYGTALTSDQMPGFLSKQVTPEDAARAVETSEDVVVARVGRVLYEKFFRGYTRKAWGLDPSELDASVTARIPVRFDRDDRYFTDTYQAMPRHGYTRMFQRMLADIPVLLNTDYRAIVNVIPHRELIYTGAIDDFYDYRMGALPYRSLKFEWETRDVERHQPVAQINFPNHQPYTRVTEFKHMTGQRNPQTTLAYEYSTNVGEPYYPVPSTQAEGIADLYRELATHTPGVHFVGRLATYRYLNMDQVTASALAMFDQIKGGTPG